MSGRRRKTERRKKERKEVAALSYFMYTKFNRGYCVNSVPLERRYIWNELNHETTFKGGYQIQVIGVMYVCVVLFCFIHSVKASLLVSIRYNNAQRLIPGDNPSVPATCLVFSKMGSTREVFIERQDLFCVKTQVTDTCCIVNICALEGDSFHTWVL